MEKQHLALMIHDRAQKYGDREAQFYKRDGQWFSYTWNEMIEMIDDSAMALLESGIIPEDCISIYAHNKPEWTICDYAIQSIRAITATVYATNPANELEYIINDSGARILFAGDQFQYDNSIKIFDSCKTLEKIIVFDNSTKIEKSDHVMYFDDFLKIGRKSGREKDVKKLLEEGKPEDVATIIYTSGTTGGPKGAMLTHSNFYSQIIGLDSRFNLSEDDIELCFLPFSHAYQKSSTHWLQSFGAKIYYCEKTDEIMEHFKEARPTFMVGVPRLYEKMYAAVYEQLKKASPLKKIMFNRAIETGKKYNYSLSRKETVSVFLNIKHKIALKLVLQKIKDIMGGRLHFFSAGGGPLTKEIEEFFFAAGILICQGYGLTETSPVITCNYADKFKFGTPGTPMDNCEIRIADDGEILVRGSNIMKGYYKKPKQTAEAFTKDGWFMTGDIGIVDEEGFLHITDRKKDIIITAGGKNIAPQRIESKLGMDYYIEQLVCIGDKKKYMSALVVPSFEAIEEYAKKNKIGYSSHKELISKPEIVDFYRKRIDDLSTDLARYEKIKKFTLLETPFSQDEDEITPTLKIKRKNINKKYRDIIDLMYPN